MTIVRKREYLDSLKNILSYISKDNKNRALNFKSEVDNKINNLANFPHKFRPSVHNEDENVRDMIFKGYTIIYLVELDENRISILDIFKWVDK